MNNKETLFKTSIFKVPYIRQIGNNTSVAEDKHCA